MQWASVPQLAHDIGDFYLLDLPRFKRNVTDLHREFTAVYPRTTIAYAYKANYTPALTEVARDLGAWAEVASGLEFDLARAADLPGEHIIVNGPRKDLATLGRMAAHGALIVVESAAMVQDIALLCDLTPRVLVRVHLDGDDAPVSRFGVAESELPAIVTALRSVARLEGFSYHFSGDRCAEGARLRARRVACLARQHFGPAGPPVLDLGGGLASAMPEQLRAQMGVPSVSFGEYAEAIAGEVRATFGPVGPNLVIEPGTAVVADCASYVVEVIDVKTLGGRNYAVVNGTTHSLKPTGHGYALPYRVLGQAGGTSIAAPLDVVGDSCMEHDVLIRECPEGLAVGDVIVFDNVGAYCIVMRPPFITGAPPIIGWDGEGWRWSRRRASASDLLATSLQEVPVSDE